MASHVSLQHVLSLDDAAAALSVHYDDSNRLLLSATGSCVVSHPVDGRGESVTTEVSEGPVLAARFSLDDCNKVLAVQRSASDVEFVAADGGSFWQRCRRVGEIILGFFWASSGGVDFVLATTCGLELYALLPARNGLRLVEEKRKTGVAWLLYTHETRLALLGCGPLGNRLFGFQFSGAGRVRLPKFELPATSPVNADSVRLLACYGRLFCAHVDGEARRVVLYRFYRDALLRQHSFPLPSPAVAASVIDNALVLHTLDPRGPLSFVLDVLSASIHPLASPLPLGLAETPPGGEQELPAASELHFLPPDLVLHRSLGRLWRLRLDLRMLTASASDRPMLVGFLQRRREPSARAPAEAQRAPYGPKALTISVVRRMLQERDPLADLGKAFEVLATACGNASAAASSPSAVPQAKPLPSGSPAVTVEVLLTEVFAPLAEEAGVDGVYLRAAIVEYLRAADAAGATPPAELQSLLVDLLVRDKCAHQLPMWAPLLLPAPASRSQPFAAAAAQSLIQAAESVSTESVQQLAFDARCRAHTHDALVRAMLAAGQVVQALRYVRRNRVESVPPALFVEAAAALEDASIFSAVFHFCSNHVPGFAQLPDYPYWRGLMPS